MFLIGICHFLEATRKTWRFLVVCKTHHPQDSEGSPRYGIVAGIFFLCNSKLRREILKKRSTHLPSTLAVRLLQGQVWNNYWGYYWIPCIYTFMEFTIIKMFHTQNISDCYVENKITSSKNFNFSTCKISWKTQPPFHDPNPSFVALVWEKSHSTVITSLKRQGRWKQILHVVSPGDFSQRASAPKCVFFFQGGEVTRGWARGLSLCCFFWWRST